MSRKKYYIWVLMIGLVFLILAWLGWFYGANPLRHSIDSVEFRNIMSTKISSACASTLWDISPTEFNIKLFPIWEQLHIIGRQLWRDMVSNRIHFASGRSFFSDQYILGHDQQSLVIVVSGFNNRVCLITVEPPLENTNLDKECLQILQQEFGNMVK